MFLRVCVGKERSEFGLSGTVVDGVIVTVPLDELSACQAIGSCEGEQ
jgi:hypothetical protein